MPDPTDLDPRDKELAALRDALKRADQTNAELAAELDKATAPPPAAVAPAPRPAPTPCRIVMVTYADETGAAQSYPAVIVAVHHHAPLARRGRADFVAPDTVDVNLFTPVGARPLLGVMADVDAAPGAPRWSWPSYGRS